MHSSDVVRDDDLLKEPLFFWGPVIVLGAPIVVYETIGAVAKTLENWEFTSYSLSKFQIYRITLVACLLSFLFYSCLIISRNLKISKFNINKKIIADFAPHKIIPGCLIASILENSDTDVRQAIAVKLNIAQLKTTRRFSTDKKILNFLKNFRPNAQPTSTEESERISYERYLLSNLFKMIVKGIDAQKLINDCHEIYGCDFSNVISNHLSKKLSEQNVKEIQAFAKKHDIGDLLTHCEQFLVRKVIQE